MYQVIAVVFLIFGASSGASIHRSSELHTSSLNLVPDINGNLYWSDTRSIPIAPIFDAEEDVKFLLYTRDNPDIPQMVTTDPLKFGDRPIKFLIHGWQNDGNSRFNELIRKALLEADDVTVIVVDWGAGAHSLIYDWARSYTVSVGEQVAKFMIFLKDNNYIAGFHQINIIGHSLGAHAAGHAGKFLFLETEQKVDVIFGLDPAGPGYSVKKPEDRLDKEDATFTVVLHTNGGPASLGLFDPIGHVDLYPNRGTSQPGCILYLVNQCAHSRAYELFAEALVSDQFVANKCEDLDQAIAGDCDGSPMVFSGEVDRYLNSGIYYFKTAGRSPFGLGLFS